MATPTDGKMADRSRDDVNEIYRRAFTCLHVVEPYGDRWAPKVEIHPASLMFSRILGHSYTEELLDDKTLYKLLAEMGNES